MKQDELKLKLKIYMYIVIVLLALLCLRLVIVQLFQSDIYKTQAKENRIRLVSLKAPRGEIYTSDGEKLAANELVYTVNLTYLKDWNQEQVIEYLSSILADYYPQVTVDYIREKIEFQKYRLFEPVVIIRDIPWSLVVKLEENRQYLPGVTISIEPLRSYAYDKLAGHLLGYIHSISPEELAEYNDEKYNINSLIGKRGIEKQYEKELKGKDGARKVEVDSQGRPIRELVTLETKPGNNLFLTIDMKLQTVMDYSMEENLKKLQEKYPKAKVGSAVLLGVKNGEVLAMTSYPEMRPDDWKGNISKELVSEYYFPQGNYDPINPGAATNRAIQTSYPPGSTFKPITGMAAMEKVQMDPLNDYVNCRGRYRLAPYIACTGVHGNVNYYSAMAHSCNTYFQEMGRRAGEEELIRVAKEFGLGQKTGIDLPFETKGLVPTPEWKKELKAKSINAKYNSFRKELDEKYQQEILAAGSEEEKKSIEAKKAKEKSLLEAQYNIDYQFDTTWQSFDTFNMSIGQGANNYTVIQLANYVATIANGGKLMKPHILKKIVSPENKVIKEMEAELISYVDINSSSLAETQRAMAQVTRPGGTAYSLFYQFPKNIQVGAKTGTSETGRSGDIKDQDFHGVFIAFAPLDNPEIAFAGVVEYGRHGSESAGYVARDVFEQYFGLKDHYTEAKKKTTITNEFVDMVVENNVE